MSDFDFDEIDKAVTGALGSDTQPASNDTPAAREPQVTPQADHANDVQLQERTALEQKRSEQVAPAARRSAGRFMDVVHPSSDMRTVAPRFTPPAASSAASSVAPAQTVTEKSEAETTPAGTDDNWAKPLESPFLADAKVEKRPLGGFSLDSTKQALGEDESQEELLLEAPDEPRLEASAMPDPIDFAAHSNALPSESEDTGVSIEQEEQAQEVEELTLEEPRLKTTPERKPEAEPHAPKEAPVQPAAPASITQQYTEQPSSAPASGAIYDTENYHQPLAAAPKKRHGIWVALWIFLLVVLGAGAGVAFYLFVLPML